MIYVRKTQRIDEILLLPLYLKLKIFIYKLLVFKSIHKECNEQGRCSGDVTFVGVRDISGKQQRSVRI